MGSVKTILYIHGMGGGPDCGIGTGLEGMIRRHRIVDDEGNTCSIRVIHRLWDFDPEKGHAQIMSWVDEYRPDLIVSISLGSFHALDIHGVPHIYVSPAFGAGPAMLKVAMEMESSPLKAAMIQLQAKEVPAGHQKLIADPKVLRRYNDLAGRIQTPYLSGAITPDLSFGFFGGKDMYRTMGVVSPLLWKQIFGDSPYLDIPEADHNFSNYDIMPAIFGKSLEFLGCRIEQ